MAKFSDEYLNFFTMKLTSAAAANTLVEKNDKTSMGAFTKQAWVIHQVEFFSHGSWSGAGDGIGTSWALSTRKGLAAFPELTDIGSIANIDHAMTLGAAGDGVFVTEWPSKIHYLPPIIIAAPTLAFYFQASADFAGQRLTDQHVRIGFTAEELTADKWQEVFQTFNFAQ